MEYTNLILFAFGFGGILFHNLIKMDSINRANNGEFKFWGYLKLEKFSILISVCFVVICIMARTEIKQLEAVGNWLGLAFVAIGYMAQSLVIKYMGKAEKIVDNNVNK